MYINGRVESPQVPPQGAINVGMIHCQPTWENNLRNIVLKHTVSVKAAAKSLVTPCLCPIWKNQIKLYRIHIAPIHKQSFLKPLDI